MTRSGSARLGIAPAANEVFAVLPVAADKRLKAAGAVYHPWPADSLPAETRPGSGEILVRLVTSWQTEAVEVDRFAAILSA